MPITDSLRGLVNNYQPDFTKLQSVKHAPFLALVGITGAGKDSVVEVLLQKYGGQFERMISYTTRKPRVNHGQLEQNGREYFFTNQSQMTELLQQGLLIEAKIYADNVYGTSFEELHKATTHQKAALKDIDIQGAVEYLKLGLNVKPIFLLPPSYDIWLERLSGRHQNVMGELDFKLRLASAHSEITKALEDPAFYIIINQDLDKTAQLIYDIQAGKKIDPRSPQALKAAQQLADKIRQKLDQN